MLDRVDLADRCRVIDEFSLKFRDELTREQGKMLELQGLCPKEEYIAWANTLSDETFCGTMYTSMASEGAIELYKDMLNGNISFDDFIKDLNSL